MKKTDKLEFTTEEIGHTWYIKQEPRFSIDRVHFTTTDPDWPVRFRGTIGFKVSAYGLDGKFLQGHNIPLALTISPNTIQPIMVVNKKVDFAFDTLKPISFYSLEVDLKSAPIEDDEFLTVYLSHEMDTDFSKTKL